MRAIQLTIIDKNYIQCSVTLPNNSIYYDLDYTLKVVKAFRKTFKAETAKNSAFLFFPLGEPTVMLRALTVLGFRKSKRNQKNWLIVIKDSEENLISKIETYFDNQNRPLARESKK